MSEWEKVLKKYHLEKWFCKENMVILVLVGILLIVIAIPTKEKEEVMETYTLPKMAENLRAEENSDVLKSEEQENILEYAEAMENKLASILSHIQGIGEVYVMITLQESEEVIVEKDMAEEREQTIFESEGNRSVPYVVKTVFPKVEGVVVVAQGAGTGKVTQNIMEIIQVLFDIEMHKIKVAAG